MSKNNLISDDLLIAEYTLGLLNLEETAQAHALLSKNPNAVIQALSWENKFLDLVDHLTPIVPPPVVLQHIQTALDHKIKLDPEREPMIVAEPRAATTSKSNLKPQQRQPDSLMVRIWRNVWFWRAISAALLITALSLTLGDNLKTKTIKATPLPAPSPTVRQVAILQAPGQTSTPGWVLTVNQHGGLVLNPKVRVELPEGSAMYLWTHNDIEPRPRLLSTLGPSQPATLPAATVGTIRSGQIFEITVEPSSDSPPTSPKGAILFIGREVTLD